MKGPICCRPTSVIMNPLFNYFLVGHLIELCDGGGGVVGTIMVNSKVTPCYSCTWMTSTLLGLWLFLWTVTCSYILNTPGPLNTLLLIFVIFPLSLFTSCPALSLLLHLALFLSHGPVLVPFPVLTVLSLVRRVAHMTCLSLLTRVGYMSTSDVLGVLLIFPSLLL